MKLAAPVRFAILVFLGAVLARAQFGPPGPGGPGGPGAGGAPDLQLSGAISKVFGGNTAFSASIEMQTGEKPGSMELVPGKVSFLDNMTRFVVDLSEMKSSRMRPEVAMQMKQFGMSEIIVISRPDKKLTYFVYPGLQGYVENAIKESAITKPDTDFTAETTELGKETLAGHDCVKNKVTVTDKDGGKQEFTVWNATDLKQFPLKIETGGANPTTMTFKDVKLEKPEAAVFDPPSDATKYSNVMTMVQQGMIKKLGGGAPK